MLVTAVFWASAAAWLLLRFPFDFSNLTSVMPSQTRVLLNWVTNDIGRILFGIGLVGALAFIPFYMIQYAKLGTSTIRPPHS